MLRKHATRLLLLLHTPQKRRLFSFSRAAVSKIPRDKKKIKTSIAAAAAVSKLLAHHSARKRKHRLRYIRVFVFSVRKNMGTLSTHTNTHTYHTLYFRAGPYFSVQNCTHVRTYCCINYVCSLLAPLSYAVPLQALKKNS